MEVLRIPKSPFEINWPLNDWSLSLPFKKCSVGTWYGTTTVLSSVGKFYLQFSTSYSACVDLCLWDEWNLSVSQTGHALRIWICGCSLFYKRELLATKSAGAHSTKSLKISGCKRWCTKDLRVLAPAAPVLTHSLPNTRFVIFLSMLFRIGFRPIVKQQQPDEKKSCFYDLPLVLQNRKFASFFLLFTFKLL